MASTVSAEDDLDDIPLVARRRFLLPKRPRFSSVSSSHMHQGDPPAKRSFGRILEEWPGLPRGLKFDPSDEDLVWHLLAKVGKEGFLPHPFVDTLIISLDESDGIFHGDPLNLPGIKRDGSMSYFFHREFKICDTGSQKCRKKNNVDSGNLGWRKVGKTKPVVVDRIHNGCKKIMVLYMSNADSEKLKKTNWVMHQYCLGTGEGEDGDLVVSKVFYQQRSKQGDMPLENMVDPLTELEPVSHAKSADFEPHASDQHCTPVESPSPSQDGSSRLTVDSHIRSGTDLCKNSIFDSPDSVIEPKLFMVYQSSLVGCYAHGNNNIMLKGICAELNEDNMFQHQTLEPEIGGKRPHGDILGPPEKSRVTLQSLPEVTKPPDDLLPISRGLHEKSERAYPVEAGFSESMSSQLGQGLARINKDNKQPDLVRPNFSIQLKTEPLEEHPIGHVDDANEDNQLLDPGPLDSLIEFKTELLEDSTISNVHEENVGKLQISSLSHYPAESLDTAAYYMLKASHQQDNVLSGATDSGDNALWTSFLEEVQLPSTAARHSSSSSSNTVAVQNACVISHDSTKADLPFSYSNVQEESGNTLLSPVSSSIPVKVKLECLDDGLNSAAENSQSVSPGLLVSGDEVKREVPNGDSIDVIDHMPLFQRRNILLLGSEMDQGNILKSSQATASKTSKYHSLRSANAKATHFPLRRKRKKTATNSVEAVLEEDAPGLLQVLIEKGISAEEIKLYGDAEDDAPIEISSSEDSFEGLENVINKLFCGGSSLFKFPPLRPVKRSKAAYCLACLISLIEQARYLQFRNSPVEWGWCRDLQSFIFVFERHNRIVLERPEYGYATYFFELIELLPVDWQIKRLVTALKLSSCGRTNLIENKPLLVGEDLSEGEARVLEEYGWRPNTGLGSMLNYCDRVVHDKREERCISEWRARIKKLLMAGYDGGRIVLDCLPKKVVEYMGNHSPQINLRQENSVSYMDSRTPGIKVEQ